MAEKVAKLGIARDKDYMLYVKDGAVWRVRRKQPGVPKGKPEIVENAGFEMDSNYIYFVDKDGDVSRAKRAIGGQKRKKKAGAKKTANRATGRKAAKSAKGGKAAKGKGKTKGKAKGKAKAGKKKRR